MAGRQPRKPAQSSRRRNRRAEAAAAPWWSLGPPGPDEPLDLLGMGILDDLLAEIVAERESQISIRKRGRPTKKQKALDEADALVGVAEGFEGQRARDVATEALGLSPDCALAHVLLAELSDDADAAERQYRLGVAAGERALGKEAIERHMGELGRVVEAKGYLNARRGLAECLTILGRPEEAIAECEALARLDAEDRIFARFMHLDLLISNGRFAAAKQLCEECREEVFCAWPYARALIAFGEEGDTPAARQLLAEAIAANPHVPRLLLSGREFDPGGMLTVGAEDEAEAYVRDFRGCWMDVPGAMAWLRACGDVPLEDAGRGRSDRRAPAGPRTERRPGWAQEKRLLAQLPLDATDAWEVDLSEEREGIWSFMVASIRDDRQLALDVLEDRPLPDDLWGMLADVMRRPKRGEPGRPATVAMRPGVFPKTWRRKLEQIGIRQIIREKLDTIDRISSDVEARIAAAAAERDADGAAPAAAIARILADCALLPREAGDVWEALVRRAPAWVTGEGQPYLPWLAIVASQTTGALLKFEMTRERTDSNTVVRLIGRAMLATGVRPEQLHVLDPALGATLSAAFADLDVAVNTPEESLPTIDRVVASLAESMTPPEAVAPLSAVPGITADIAGAFYAAAAAFHRDRPWRRLPSDAAINVHVPAADGGAGRLVHAVVIGHVGVVQGLAVYEDDVALAAARSGDHEQVGGSTGLSVMFGEAFEIPAFDYDWIERSGFEVAGPEAWPMPVRLNPGMNLRPPLVWELELLTGCLRDVAAFIATVPRPKGGLLGWGRPSGPSTWTSPAGWRLSWE
jgi:tetratricopeptide (TPR) repeat protein